MVDRARRHELTPAQSLGAGVLPSEDADQRAKDKMMDDVLTRAQEAALIALRREQPVPRWALPALADLNRVGLLEREGLTPAGIKEADALIATLAGLNAMISRPHRRDAAFERGRAWTR